MIAATDLGLTYLTLTALAAAVGVLVIAVAAYRRDRKEGRR